MTKTKRIAKPVAAPVIIETRDVKAARRFEYLEDELASTISQSSAEIAKWSERLSSDPASAFEWSTNAFKAAGAHRAATWVKEMVEAGKEPDEYTSAPPVEKIIKAVRDYLYVEVVRKARWPDRSTSAPSNEMSLLINAAMADWLEKIDRMIERIEA